MFQAYISQGFCLSVCLVLFLENQLSLHHVLLSELNLAGITVIPTWMASDRRMLAPVFERERLSLTFINALFSRCALNHGEGKNGASILVLAEDFGLFPIQAERCR